MTGENMTTAAGALIALGLVIAAWVTKAQQPPPMANVAGWVIAIVGTVLLLLAAFTEWAPR
jgi:hypothetical protein